MQTVNILSQQGKHIINDSIVLNVSYDKAFSDKFTFKRFLAWALHFPIEMVLNHFIEFRKHLNKSEDLFLTFIFMGVMILYFYIWNKNNIIYIVNKINCSWDWNHALQHTNLFRVNANCVAVMVRKTLLDQSLRRRRESGIKLLGELIEFPNWMQIMRGWWKIQSADTPSAERRLSSCSNPPIS